MATTRSWAPASLVPFLVPVTLAMHNFWKASDAAMFRLELMLFVRNAMLLGAAVFVARSGAGALSLDALMVDVEPVAELDYFA